MKDPDEQPDLLTPSQFLKGVGPQRAEVLAKLGLKTARDVIFFFPRDYRDLTELTSIRPFEIAASRRVSLLRKAGRGQFQLEMHPVPRYTVAHRVAQRY